MKKLLFAAGVLLTGCQSERVAFQFQPGKAAVATARPAVVPTAMALEGSTLPDTAAIAPAETALPTSVQQPTTAHRQARAQHASAVLAAHPELALAAARLPLVAKPRLLPRLALRRHATSGAAESGLGRIGLFFIAVFLGVLAGLAALVNVIFSIGFFTSLGYVAAGLVVLALLYLLFSGGKKKVKTSVK